MSRAEGVRRRSGRAQRLVLARSTRNCSRYNPFQMSLPPGTRLGPYDVTAQIGVGVTGEVYGGGIRGHRHEAARADELKQDTGVTP